MHIDKGAYNSVEYANNFLFSLKLSILCYGLKIVFQKEAENYKQETLETLTIIKKYKRISYPEENDNLLSSFLLLFQFICICYLCTCVVPSVSQFG